MSLSNIIGTVLVNKGAAALSLLGAGAITLLASKISEQSFGKAVDVAKIAMAAGKADSLIAYSQAARVEPILLMDQKALYIPFIEDVVHTMNSLFTAYYLQSVALDTTLSGIKVIKRLDKFNPDRSLSEATSAFFSQESYGRGLPVLGVNLGLEAYGASFEARGNVNQGPPSFQESVKRAIQAIEVKDEAMDQTRHSRTQTMQSEMEVKRALEKKYPTDTPEKRLEKGLQDAEIKRFIENKFPNDTPEKRMEKALQDAEIKKFVEDQYKKDPVSSVATKDISKMVTDVANLAVGKVIEVTITEGDHTARIPVTIRLRVTSMPSPVLVETLAVGGVDVTAGSRWKAWRAGELGFWSDIVLAQDRIDAHRNAVRKDASGFYNAVYSRANKNLSAEILGAGPSVGTASAIIVLTEQTKKDLERKIGGRLSDYKTRQNIFINTFSMLMCVVDQEWETVTIYHRGIEMPTELAASYLKTSSKGNGPDVAEIMKAYQLGNAPHRL
jgi:hypothetical protein